ncbi:MAG: ABC transporter ATP-binding protein [Deltaproteobacteria bacterium]
MTLLNVQDLYKNFGGILALSQVSFQVARGEIVGVIGPNGAGKTTLFNCVTGIESPTRGRLRFKDLDLTGMTPHELVRNGMARTFQTARAFHNLSVIENVMVARHIRSRSNIFYDLITWPKARREERACRERAIEYLALVKLDELAETRADQLTLSQARRLELARALATEPEILLLDEPCAGMDEIERQELCRLLTEVQQLGVTLMVIEHDIGMVVNLCTQIIVLNFGRIIAQGTPEEVQRDEQVLEAYLGDRSE